MELRIYVYLQIILVFLNIHTIFKINNYIIMIKMKNYVSKIVHIIGIFILHLQMVQMTIGVHKTIIV